jgi:hypothetical protein
MVGLRDAHLLRDDLDVVADVGGFRRVDPAGHVARDAVQLATWPAMPCSGYSARPSAATSPSRRAMTASQPSAGVRPSSCASAHAASRATSMPKSKSISSSPGAMSSMRLSRGDTSPSSSSTTITSRDSTWLIILKSGHSDCSASGEGATVAAAIPRSRLMWAFIPTSRCWTTRGPGSSSSANAACQLRLGVPPDECWSHAARKRSANTTSSRSIRGLSWNTFPATSARRTLVVTRSYSAAK